MIFKLFDCKKWLWNYIYEVMQLNEILLHTVKCMKSKELSMKFYEILWNSNAILWNDNKFYEIHMKYYEISIKSWKIVA